VSVRRADHRVLAARARGAATPDSGQRLRPALDALYESFDHVTSATDPVHVVRRYPDPADREVVGFVAAGLAFGRVASVLQSIESLLAAMGPHPAAFVRAFEPGRDRGPIEPLVHRWIRGRDLVALLLVLRHMLRASGSIEEFFLEGDDPASPDVGPALESFSRRALAVDVREAYGRGPAPKPGVAYFFSRPSSGGACKRLNLYLRWMVRRDAIDLGVWTRVPPSRLIVPLDTHVIRLGRCLRLTRYSSPGWRMAADITASLRAIDPADPIRYDFSLCHVGMMSACGFSRAQGDARCPLRGLCRPRARRPRRSPPPSAPR
jgi:uncharacterized protein (TIGR02757 family)